jgi:hypothetical protein
MQFAVRNDVCVRTGKGGDDAGLRIDATDAVVADVADI